MTLAAIEQADQAGDRYLEIRRMLGKHYARIAALYLEHLPLKLTELATFADQPATPELTRWLHSFKGMSRTIGASRLGDLLARCEQGSKVGQGLHTDDCQQIAEHARSSLQHVGWLMSDIAAS